jgi:hypothetical protein
MKKITAIKLFLSTIASFILLLGSVLAPSAARAESSPWSSDSLYGCVGHSISDFITDSQPDSPFVVSMGVLPPGLNLDVNTGIISGSPTAIFSGSFTISSANSNYPSTSYSALIDNVCRPEVTSVIPNKGSLAGGTRITIAANNLMNDATVNIDDAGTLIPVSITSRDANHIYALTPAFSNPGAVDYIVRNGDGSRVRVAGAFTYLPATSVEMYSTDGTGPITTINTVHFSHHSPDGFGEVKMLALHGFGAKSGDLSYSLNLQFDYHSDGSYNSVLNDMNVNCQNGPAVSISNSTPSYAPTNPGIVYRELEVQTGTLVGGAPYSCIPVGTYAMELHVFDNYGNSNYFYFTIVESPGAATQFLQPIIDGAVTFGTLHVAQPMADNPDDPNPGMGIRTDGDHATYSISSASPLIPDLAVQLTAGGKGGGGDPYISGIPTRSGTYSFEITASVAGANPSTYSHTFSGLVTYTDSSTVTFEGNGATSGSMSPQRNNYVTALTTNSYSRSGYTFNGWSTNPLGGGRIYTDRAEYEFDTNTNLYAQWVAISPTSHSITFNGNGATFGSTGPQTHAGPAPVMDSSFIRSGYLFDEWNTSPAGTGTIFDAGETYSFAQDLVLYAMWKLPSPTVAPGVIALVPHTVSYDGNGATGGSVSQQVSTSAAPLRPNTFIRPGYTFHDWNSTTNHTGLELDAGDIFSFDRDITFYAEWTKDPSVGIVISADSPLVINLLAGESKALDLVIRDSTGVSATVSVLIPAGIVSVDGQIRISPTGSASGFSQGLISLRVEILDLFGAVIPALLQPITLHFNTQLGENIVAKSEDGLIWTPVPLISGTTLSAGQLDGYYIDSTGGVVIVSGHLTEFGFKKAQSSAVNFASTFTNQKVGMKQSTLVSGGDGGGTIIYSTSTPKVCTIDSFGVITGNAIGTCVVEAMKVGDATYIQQSPSPISVVISAGASAPTPLAVLGHARIIINLGALYGQKVVQVQSLTMGANSYKTIQMLKLDKNGSGIVVGRFSSTSHIRVLSYGKSIAKVAVK